jgi:hypothetical protein
VYVIGRSRPCGQSLHVWASLIVGMIFPHLPSIEPKNNEAE